MSALATRFRAPQQSPGFMLWRTTNAWQRSIRATLEPHELTHVQFVLLATLASLQPASVTQRQLADAAATDVMMTSQVVRTLASRGLLERGNHPTDGRAVLLTLTAQGLSVANVANVAVEEADERFFAALNIEDIASLVTMLATLSGGSKQVEGRGEAEAGMVDTGGLV